MPKGRRGSALETPRTSLPPGVLTRDHLEKPPREAPSQMHGVHMVWAVGKSSGCGGRWRWFKSGLLHLMFMRSCASVFSSAKWGKEPFHTYRASAGQCEVFGSQ